MADLDNEIANISSGSSFMPQPGKPTGQESSQQPGQSGGTGRLAVITGASSGIGLELARIAARHGHDLVLAAHSFDAGFDQQLSEGGESRGQVTRVEGDLSTAEGIDRLVAAIGDRPVSILCANAGHGLGEAFLEQDFTRVRHLIDTNITGTIDLVQRIAAKMRTQGRGRILFTGSIAGTAPGPFSAAYNGSKAFINSFAEALREELKDSGVCVTVLMPGPVDTRFFERAGLQSSRVGEGPKSDPKKVAEIGWQALMSGDDKVVAGPWNKVEALLARVMPMPLAAKLFGYLYEPGGAEEDAERRKAMLPLLIGGGLAAGALAFLLTRGRHTAPSNAARRPDRRFASVAQVR